MRNSRFFTIIFLLVTVFGAQAMETEEDTFVQYTERVQHILQSFADIPEDSLQNLTEWQRSHLQKAQNDVIRTALMGGICLKKKNVREAKHWYAKAAFFGKVSSLFDLGMVLRNENDDNWEVLVNEAADKGDYRAQVYLGRIQEAY